MKLKKMFIHIIFMLLLVGSVLGATIPSRYTLDFYDMNGIQRLTHVNTTQLNVGNGTSVGNINTSNGNINFNIPNSIMVNGVRVCLVNDSSCSQNLPITNTSSSIFIKDDILQMDASSTSVALIMNYTVASAFVGAFKTYKSGNSTSTTGNPRSGDELAVWESDIANGSGSFVRRSAFVSIADNNHDGSTSAGTRWLIKVTDRGTNNYVTAGYMTGTGWSITNSSSVGTQPNERLVVDGDINVTQVIKMNNYAYPSCTTARAGQIAYNGTRFKHVGCNGTAWNNLY